MAREFVQRAIVPPPSQSGAPAVLVAVQVPGGSVGVGAGVGANVGADVGELAPEPQADSIADPAKAIASGNDDSGRRGVVLMESPPGAYSITRL